MCCTSRATFLGGGFWLLSSAWHVLYHAQRRHALATVGPYARIRHPQYDGFVLILLGFLLQRPTLLTLLMFPVLVVMYARLATSEETEMRARFGAAWEAYAARTPRFIPAFGASRQHPARPQRAGLSAVQCKPGP